MSAGHPQVWGEVVGYAPSPYARQLEVAGAMMPGVHPPHPYLHQHPHHHHAHLADVGLPVPGHMLIEQEAQEELRKNAKRAANRRSASTCRARKKFLAENMAEANDRMRKRSRVLSLLPDMILAMRRDGVVTYASENCRQFLKFTREEVEGANIFDLVEAGSHDRLRRLLEENLGSVSKEAIASALRHQGTTFEALLARSEKAKEQGDVSFFSASGEAPQFSGPASSSLSDRGRSNGAVRLRRGLSSGSGSGGGGAQDVEGSTDDWEESEVTSSACEGYYGRTSSAASSSNCGGSGSGGGSGASEVDVGAPHPRAKRRLPPPLGPAAFSSGKVGGAAPKPETVKAEEGTTLNATRRQRGVGGGVRSRAGGVGVVMRGSDAGTSETSSARGGSGSGSSSSSASMVNVDRDLQSKINAFTNNQKDLCKLELARQDKKSDWCEVRSSMRLVWLKSTQEIVPVEVICSFQRMHCDGPAGSANSIVDRLQRVAAMVRPPPSDDHHHPARAGGVACGFRVNGASKVRGKARGKTGSDGGSSVGRAASSSDYGGGASSGSLSGSGPDNNNRLDGEKEGREAMDGGRPSSRERARVVCAPVVTPCPDEQRQRREVAGEVAGDGGTGGGQAPVGGRATPRALPPTARRLALSAKKTILFRYGFDSSKTDAVDGRV